MELTTNAVDLLPKQKGVSPTEEYLAELCERVFLGFWTYPSLYNDKGINKGQGKELCDLLAVFGDDVVIFSDKSCAYPQTAKPRLNWQRWCREAILKSAYQAQTAEKWLRAHPKRIFFDRACQQRLPAILPPANRMRVHRVAIVSAPFDPSDGKIDNRRRLAIVPEVRGSEHVSDASEPFYVGDVCPDADFVHVFDLKAARLLLRHLNTAPDFLRYLTHRATLIRSSKLEFAQVEEDILATFLGYEMSRADFNLIPGNRGYLPPEGTWKRFTEMEEYRLYQQLKTESVQWDKLIQSASLAYRFGRMVANTGASDAESIEFGLRLMAQETRHSRWNLTKKLMNFFHEEPDGLIRTLVVRSMVVRTTAYVFVSGPDREGLSADQLSVERQLRAKQACYWARSECPDATDFVAITCGDDPDGTGSWTITHRDFREWTPDMQGVADALRKSWNVVTRSGTV